MNSSEIISIFNHFTSIEKNSKFPATYCKLLKKICAYLMVLKKACSEDIQFEKKQSETKHYLLEKKVALTHLQSNGFKQFCVSVNNLNEMIRAVNLMARSSSLCPIDTSSKTSYSIVLNEESSNFCFILSQILRSSSTISGLVRPPTYRVVVGLSLTSYHAWLASRAFRASPGLKACPEEILISHGNSETVEELAKKGEIDLAITPVLGRNGEPKNGELLGTRELTVALMLDRRAFKSSPPKHTNWVYLAGKTLLVVDDGFGLYEICRDKAPPTAKIETSKSWDAAMASVLASKNVCCIACPSTLPSRDRTRFIEVQLEGLGMLKVGVYKFPQRSHSDNVGSEVVEALGKQYLKQLDGLSKETSEISEAIAENFQRTAHLSYDPQGKRIWVMGEIENLKIAPNGRLRADHVSNLGGKRSFTTMDGKITIKRDVGDDTTDTFYVACRFWKKGLEQLDAPDSHVVYLVYNKNQNEGYLIGSWSGMPSWYEKFPFLTGPFLAGSRDRFELQNGKPFSGEHFDLLVKEHLFQKEMDLGSLWAHFDEPLNSKKINLEKK